MTSYLIPPEEILSLIIYNKWKGIYFLYQKHSAEIKFNNIPLKIKQKLYSLYWYSSIMEYSKIHYIKWQGFFAKHVCKLV